ncbi:polysaccharide deacetylase family protein [Rhodococcus sp. PvR099]|uniref:polysaccharide deacetylase family protein n=1 Tax=Rhodococcus sp. PvR099 TaxID=2806602 RepID=UPI001B6F1422|nr:polysaccharide deacetylase family protein [Rhodococcus sp. PvR099]MBP1160055.1 peptidoglycan/xylan/chitin deacetylase (PgdA/CDA1 family) [Rhodococcus sp. PvR099]
MRSPLTRRSLLLGLAGGVAVAAHRFAVVGGPTVASSEPLPVGPADSLTDYPLLSPVRPAVATVQARYAGAVPREWGVAVSGTRTRLAPPDRRLALTFDACGGPGGTAVDADLLVLLERERLPATLFLNGRWIDANPALTVRLADNPLIELGNHGTQHLPLSVTGRSAYGIAGTRSVAEVIDEVLVNHRRLQEITGVAPRWFRPGTAHCDEVAAAIVRDLGEEVVGFTMNGDSGATMPTSKVQGALTSAAPGSIVIAHMNRPAGDTAEGLAAALPALRAQDREFVTLGGAGALA